MIEAVARWLSATTPFIPMDRISIAYDRIRLDTDNSAPPQWHWLLCACQRPSRSKHEPHRELIRELRLKGRTYREVAKLFTERLGLYVAPSPLHSFVKARAKHRKRAQFELPPLKLAVTESPVIERVAVLKANVVSARQAAAD
jgi:hypothetical protein